MPFVFIYPIENTIHLRNFPSQLKGSRIIQSFRFIKLSVQWHLGMSGSRTNDNCQLH